MVGLSFFYRNTALRHLVTKHVRAALGDHVFIAWGGPSVDSDRGQRIDLVDPTPPDHETQRQFTGRTSFPSAGAPRSQPGRPVKLLHAAPGRRGQAGDLEQDLLAHRLDKPVIAVGGDDEAAGPTDDALGE